MPMAASDLQYIDICFPFTFVFGGDGTAIGGGRRLSLKIENLQLLLELITGHGIVLEPLRLNLVPDQLIAIPSNFLFLFLVSNQKPAEYELVILACSLKDLDLKKKDFTINSHEGTYAKDILFQEMQKLHQTW